MRSAIEHNNNLRNYNEITDGRILASPSDYTKHAIDRCFHKAGNIKNTARQFPSQTKVKYEESVYSVLRQLYHHPTLAKEEKQKVKTKLEEATN